MKMEFITAFKDADTEAAAVAHARRYRRDATVREWMLMLRLTQRNRIFPSPQRIRKMIGSCNLTSSDGQLETLARATWPGQASWAVEPERAANVPCGLTAAAPPRLAPSSRAPAKNFVSSSVTPCRSRRPTQSAGLQIFEPNAAPPAAERR